MRKLIKYSLLFTLFALSGQSCDDEITQEEISQNEKPQDDESTNEDDIPNDEESTNGEENPNEGETTNSDDDNNGDDNLQTITLPNGAGWHNNCNFKASYQPYSTNNSYSDNIHQEGQHVFCTINDKLYEVEFISTGTRSSHFEGEFHVIKIDGQEIEHEDGIVWKEGSRDGKLYTYSKRDTSFNAPFYKIHNAYGDNSIVIPGKIINIAIEETQRIYQLDTLRQNHANEPDFVDLFWGYPYIQIADYSIIFNYNEEKGYYYTINGADYTVSQDSEIILQGKYY